MHAVVFTVVVTIALLAAAEMEHGLAEGGAFLVPTFHCIGIYWPPPEGREGFGWRHHTHRKPIGEAGCLRAV